VSNAPSGFDFQRRKDNSVLITHNGKTASTLRVELASEFLEDMADTDDAEAQEIMARLTGNYRRGNERLAKKHPRNG